MRTAEHKKLQSLKQKGKTLSPEHLENLRKAIKKRKKLTGDLNPSRRPEVRAKISKANTGKKYPHRKPLTAEGRENIRIGVKKSWSKLSYTERVSRLLNTWEANAKYAYERRRERGELTVKRLCQKYNIPFGIEFIPSSWTDHLFAREVLINRSAEGKKLFPKDYVEQTGLREHPFMNPKNPKEEILDAVRFVEPEELKIPLRLKAKEVKMHILFVTA